MFAVFDAFKRSRKIPTCLTFLGACALFVSTSAPAQAAVALSMFSNCLASSASGTAYVCSTTYPSVAPPGAGGLPGLVILLKVDVANTGAATLRADAGIAAPIRKQGGSAALAANDFLPGQLVPLSFDGTYWQVLGTLGNAAGGSSGSHLLTTPTSNQVTTMNGATVDLAGSVTSISGNTLGANECFRVTYDLLTTGTSAKQFRLVWDIASAPGNVGALWGGNSLADTGTFKGTIDICAAGSTSAQNVFAGPIIGPTGYPPPSAAGILAANTSIDTTQALVLKLTAASSLTTETVTLKSWVVEHLRQ